MKKVLVVFRQDSGVGYYRQRVPARILERFGYDVTLMGPYNSLTPKNKTLIDHPELKDAPGRRRRAMAAIVEQFGKFDAFLHDRATEPEEMGIYAGLRHNTPGCRMAVDFDDDFLQVPPWNPAKNSYYPGMLSYEVGKMHLKLAEVTTVSTPALEKSFAVHTHKIICCHNLIDPKDWVGHPVNPERDSDPCLRILYGGASGHYGDMDEARDGLMKVLLNPPVPIRLICFGALPRWVHDLRRACPQRVISLPWTDFHLYPRAVAWGGFDLAIAPLANHPFNWAKSNIKYLEATLQNIPFICSDVGPYSEIPDGCAVKVDNTEIGWSEGVIEALLNAEMRSKMLKQATEDVMENWTMTNPLKSKMWHTVIEELGAAKRIESEEDARLPGEQGTVLLTQREPDRQTSNELGGRDAQSSDDSPCRSNNAERGEGD